MKTLDELWFGNIAPMEQCNSYSQEMRELIGYVARHREELDNTLTDKQKETLEKLMDCSNELNGKFERQAFEYGFKLGMQLTIEGTEPILPE